MARTLDIVIPAHRVAAEIGATLASIRTQRLPPGWSVHVHVADDGSPDNLSAALAGLLGKEDRLLRHPTNRGRSAACNTAAAGGTGEIVAVLDADCRYADPDTLARLLGHFERGADVVLGTVTATGDGFWARYARDVARARIARARRAGVWHMTTANFAIRRHRFEALGGFAEAYSQYGFEDRDLLIRLSRTDARFVVTEDVAVDHREFASVEEVCRKMFTGARFSSGIFAKRFPDEYRASAYSRLDLARHPRLARLARPFLAAGDYLARRVAAACIRAGWVGYVAKAASLRIASALSFMHGSACAGPSEQPGAVD